MSTMDNRSEQITDLDFDRTTQKPVFNQITEKVSDGLEQLAGFINEKVSGINEGDNPSTIGKVGEKTVGFLNNSANYIRNSDFDQIQTDVRESIKRNPERSLLVGLGVGILLGSIFRKKG